MMTKKMITVPVGAVPKVGKSGYGNTEVLRYESSYGANIYVETTLDDLISTLTDMRKRYKGTYSNLRIDSKRDCGCPYDCTCSPTYYVAGTRLEDDVEYDYRIRYETRLKAEREARERKEYEILKAKFDNPTAER